MIFPAINIFYPLGIFQPQRWSIRKVYLWPFPQYSLWYSLMTYQHFWLLVYLPTPLKNDGLRQLGWWHSQYDGKNNPAMFQTTNLIWSVGWTPHPPRFWLSSVRHRPRSHRSPWSRDCDLARSCPQYHLARHWKGAIFKGLSKGSRDPPMMLP